MLGGTSVKASGQLVGGTDVRVADGRVVLVATAVLTAVDEATLVEVDVDVEIEVEVEVRVAVRVPVGGAVGGMVGGTGVGVFPQTTPWVKISMLSVGAVGAYPPAR